jgi:hypothetical protein
LRITRQLQQGISVLGNGNFDVGDETTPCESSRSIAERLDRADRVSDLRIGGQNPLKTHRARVCAAMTQQGGDSGRGNDSAPQKFVHLVGCRDPKARPGLRSGAVPKKP